MGGQKVGVEGERGKKTLGRETTRESERERLLAEVSSALSPGAGGRGFRIRRLL